MYFDKRYHKPYRSAGIISQKKGALFSDCIVKSQTLAFVNLLFAYTGNSTNRINRTL